MIWGSTQTPPPFALPPDSEKCCSSRIVLFFSRKITATPCSTILRNAFQPLNIYKLFPCTLTWSWSGGLLHLWEKDEAFLLSSISGTAALSVELPPEPHWTISQGEPRWEVCEFDPLPQWLIAVFAFFAAHQQFYSAVNLPGPECHFSRRCWIVFECFLLFFFFLFMHVCVFALEESLILDIKNRHLPRRFDLRGVFKREVWMERLCLIGQQELARQMLGTRVFLQPVHLMLLIYSTEGGEAFFFLFHLWFIHTELPRWEIVLFGIIKYLSFNCFYHHNR